MTMTAIEIEKMRIRSAQKRRAALARHETMQRNGTKFGYHRGDVRGIKMFVSNWFVADDGLPTRVVRNISPVTLAKVGQ